MTLDEQMSSSIDQERSVIAETLSRLVSIPTVNPPGRAYRECVSYISSLLIEWEIPHRVITITEGETARYALLGNAGEGRPALNFHGHYDVVPAYAEEQFHPRLDSGKLIGRGSADMKGGITSILHALRALKRSVPDLARHVSFSFVPDEETGGRLGTKHLVESGALPLPRLGMLMPEPTSGVIWNANKGALTYRVTITGVPAHVGIPSRGVNAFEQMTELAQSLIRLKKRVEERTTSLAIQPPEAARSVMLLGGESGGGINFNAVPSKSFFTIDRRLNPEETLTQAKSELEEIFDEHRRRGVNIAAELLQEGEPSAAGTDTHLAGCLRDAARTVKGREVPFRLCPGLAEIRYFIERGVPGYAYGPGLLELAHTPDEYVSITDVVECAKIYALTAVHALRDT